MVAVHFLQEVVENGATPDILDGLDWVIIPVANPDGFHFTYNGVSLLFLIF